MIIKLLYIAQFIEDTHIKYNPRNSIQNKHKINFYSKNNVEYKKISLFSRTVSVYTKIYIILIEKYNLLFK